MGATRQLTSRLMLNLLTHQLTKNVQKMRILNTTGQKCLALCKQSNQRITSVRTAMLKPFQWPGRQCLSFSNNESHNGGGGIRTPGIITGTTVFKTVAFSRSSLSFFGSLYALLYL